MSLHPGEMLAAEQGGSWLSIGTGSDRRKVYLAACGREQSDYWSMNIVRYVHTVLQIKG